MNLNLRWSAQQQAFFVEHLTLIECDTEGDMLACLEEGLRNRHTASHELNRDSSRSHTMFSIYCGGSAPALLHFLDPIGHQIAKANTTCFCEQLCLFFILFLLHHY